jgi:UDP-glucose 4-epimerase
MTILLTGGTGFMGAWIVRALMKKNHTPIIYDLRSDLSLLEDAREKFELVQGDTLDLATLIRTIKRFKITRIIHAAALTSPPNPLTGIKINVEGSINVFEAAKLMDIRRVVFISSKAAYGAITGEHAHPTYKPVTEDYRKTPDSVYGATKVAAEFMASYYRKTYGIEIVTLRFALIYGPGKSLRYKSLSIPGRIIENAVKGLETKISQGREQKTDLVYIKDVVNAIMLACFKPKLRSNVFHIGSGAGTTLLDLAEEIKKLYPKAIVEVGPGVDYLGDNRSHYCVLDISRAKKYLGYSPEFPLKKGVKDYIHTITS